MMACDSDRSHYLAGATVVEGCQLGDGRSPTVARLLAGHYVEPGRGLVLLDRRTKSGSLFSVDTQTYEKLTIELARADVGVPINLPGPNVRLFYTSGSTAFVLNAAGFYSVKASGTIVIRRRTADRLTAGLDLVILVVRSPFPESAPVEVRIKEDRTFTRIDLDNLTPLLGTCQPELGKEVNPRLFAWR